MSEAFDSRLGPTNEDVCNGDTPNLTPVDKVDSSVNYVVPWTGFHSGEFSADLSSQVLTHFLLREDEQNLPIWIKRLRDMIRGLS